MQLARPRAKTAPRLAPSPHWPTAHVHRRPPPPQPATPAHRSPAHANNRTQASGYRTSRYQRRAAAHAHHAGAPGQTPRRRGTPHRPAIRRRGHASQQARVLSARASSTPLGMQPCPTRTYPAGSRTGLRRASSRHGAAHTCPPPAPLHAPLERKARRPPCAPRAKCSYPARSGRSSTRQTPASLCIRTRCPRYQGQTSTQSHQQRASASR
mmetsp:Transcript_52613/g.118118  ORF Transcript_52613/g.118118 Transcript_52613/m.118118 type:complete len:211 (+) Transcript_52613:188-820(+)